MHTAQIQKGGFIVLPHGITLARFLQDDSLEVFWSEDAAASKLDSEVLMSDDKHLPELVSIHITIPLNKIRLTEPEQVLPNGRRANQVRNIPVGFNDLNNMLNAGFVNAIPANAIPDIPDNIANEMRIGQIENNNEEG